MAFLDKVGKIAKTAAEKTGDAVEISKLNVKIHGEKGRIDDLKTEIGSYYYEQYKSGAALPGEVAALCGDIGAREATIAALEAEKLAVGTEEEEKTEE